MLSCAVLNVYSKEKEVSTCESNAIWTRTEHVAFQSRNVLKRVLVPDMHLSSGNDQQGTGISGQHLPGSARQLSYGHALPHPFWIGQEFRLQIF